MFRKPIATIAILAALFASMYAIRQGWDIARLGMTIICCIGAVSLVFVSRDLRAGQFMLLLPAIYALVRALWGWVPGWTEYELLMTFSVASVACLGVYASGSVIVWGLIVAALLQIYSKYFGDIAWGTDAPGYVHGTVRQHIRYATVMFAGYIAAAHVVLSSRRRWLQILCGALVALFVWQTFWVYSNMLILCVLLSMLGLLWFSGKPILMAVLALFVFVAFGLIKPHGFEYDPPRIDMLNEALSYMGGVKAWLFGNGIGFWTLTHECHPHNEMLHLLVEQGAVGVVVWTIPVLAALFFLRKSPALLLGLLFITISTFTNSLRYTDVYALWMVFMALGYNMAEDSMRFPSEMVL